MTTHATDPVEDSGGRGPGALDGVRVIDLTTVLMGPLATRMLADHGADVIRIDRAEPGTDDIAGLALHIHRNKRSIALDLKSDEGASVMRDLVATADVFVSNLRADALDRLGLSATELRQRHPALIHCVANGYGAAGPDADRAAYDDAIQAGSGLAALHQRRDGAPAYVPSVIVDKTCSLVMVQAILAALLHRNATGEGQSIEVPMLETMVSLNLLEHFRHAALDPPTATMGYPRVLARDRRPYRCADGWVAILPYTGANWQDFFELIDRPELAEDPRFATQVSRIEHIDELYGLVATAAPRHSVDEWLDLCAERSIPASRIADLEELLDDPQITASGLIERVVHPTHGPYRIVHDPVGYDRLDTGLRRHPPAPGEHTAEILGELGRSAS